MKTSIAGIAVVFAAAGMSVVAEAEEKRGKAGEIEGDTEAANGEIAALRAQQDETARVLAEQDAALKQLQAGLARLREEKAADEAEVKGLREQVESLQNQAGAAEQKAEDVKGAVRAADAVDEAYSRRTEQRERSVAQGDSPFTKRVDQIMEEFLDTSGSYFRAGFGLSEGGKTQSTFKAPGALAKYRLGNENENYGELVLGKNWYNANAYSLADYQKGALPSGEHAAIGRFQLRLAFYNNWETGDVDVSFPEAWVSIGNVLPFNRSTKFWAGNRFYRRYDIHINDFYFYNMSGLGGGIEDIDIKIGRLALAWIGDTSRYAMLATPEFEGDAINRAGFSKSNLDLRLYDVKLWWGAVEIGATLSWARGGVDMNGDTVGDSVGGALNFIHIKEGFLTKDGLNTFALQIGRGPGTTFTSGFETWAGNNGAVIIDTEQNAWRFRAAEQFTVQPVRWYSMQMVAVYQFTDYKNTFEKQHWFSGGVRPIFHFTDTLGIALEAGVDFVDTPAMEQTGYLAKFTVAPQISIGGKFFSRPVVRPYFTTAVWGDDFVGQVGDAYGDKNWGYAGGVQMETWW